MSYPYRAALLDTSVAVKWFVTEDDSERAISLRRARLWDEIQLYVPDLLLMELANALRYTGRLSEGRILEDLATFSTLDISTVPFSIEVLRSSVTLSLEQDLAVYEVYFLVMAQDLGISFITADWRMLSRLTAAEGALSLESLYLLPRCTAQKARGRRRTGPRPLRELRGVVRGISPRTRRFPPLRLRAAGHHEGRILPQTSLVCWSRDRACRRMDSGIE